MDSPASAPRRRTGWRALPSFVARTLGTLFVIALSLIVLGAYFPDLFGIGVVGSALSGASTWMSIALAVALGVVVWLLTRRRTVWRGVLAGVSTVALIGSLAITAQLVSTGMSSGVTVNPFAGPPTTRAPDEVAQYGEHAGAPLTVSIWKPAGSSMHAPVAFFTHGGGWVSGASTDDVGGMIPKLTAAGWLVVSASYTLASPQRQTVDFVESQIACAMAWVARNAPTYGADAAVFASLGDSAGGNLAINTSYRANAGELSCDEIGPMPHVVATATLFPGVDPYALFDDTIAGGSHPGRTFMEQYIGGSPEEYPDEYAAVSSQTHISVDAPPTLILQGASDHLVQAHGPREFATSAEAAGVEVTLIEVPFGEHVFQATPLGAELYTGITLSWLAERVHTG